MEFLSLANKKRKVKNVCKYLIDWDAASRSKFQKSVKDFLHKYWKLDVVFEEFPIVGTRLTLDFYNPNRKQAIEVQGNHHVKYIPFFHGDSRFKFLDQLKRDQSKERFCEINNIKLITIYQNDEINEALFEKQGVRL